MKEKPEKTANRIASENLSKPDIQEAIALKQQEKIDVAENERKGREYEGLQNFVYSPRAKSPTNGIYM